MEVKNLWEVVLPRLRSSINESLTVEQVAEFCHVSPKTVGRWVEDENPANGEHLIRLWHLLAFVGNDSPELDSLKPLQRFVSELFAFDLIGAAKACEILNLKPEKPSYMYHILRGSEVLKPQYTHEELVDEYRDELRGMKQIYREEFIRNIPTEQTSGVPDTSNMSSAEVQPVMSFQGDASVLLASLVSAIRPIADALLDDDTALEARNRFRELVSDETLFEVTNKLNALSSERARKTR